MFFVISLLILTLRINFSPSKWTEYLDVSVAGARINSWLKFPLSHPTAGN